MNARHASLTRPLRAERAGELDRLVAVLRRSPVALAIVDADLRLLRATDGFRRMTGMPPAEAGEGGDLAADRDAADAAAATTTGGAQPSPADPPLALADALPLMDARLVGTCRRVLDGEDDTATAEFDLPARADTALLQREVATTVGQGWSGDGERSVTTVALTVFPLAGDAEDEPLLGIMATDVSARWAYELRWARTATHLEFLAEASRLLAESLDLEQTLDTIVHLLVPALADACLVFLHEPGEQPAPDQLVTTRGLDATQLAAIGAVLARSMPASGQLNWGGMRAERTGRGELLSPLPDRVREQIREIYMDAGFPDLPVASSLLAIPLMSSGVGIGRIYLATFGERRFDGDDLAFAEELGRRAAAATQNARLHRAVAEQAHAARTLANAVVGMTTDAVVVVDVEGRITGWNEAATELYGYAPEEAIGHEITMLHPQPHGRTTRALAERLLAGESVPRHEARRVHSSGRLLDVSLRASPLLDSQGNVVGASSTAHDISAQRRAERLQRRHARELARINDRLREVNALKNAFLSMASHELRSPLAAISGLARTLGDMWTSIDDTQRHMIVNEICDNADRLTRLVRDLMTVSRIEEGMLLSRPEAIDVAPIVDLAVTEAGRGDVRVVVDPSMQVYADPDHVRQILVNLVTNALHHGAPPVEISARAQDGEVVVSIVDHGKGIPPELRGDLFERFARVRMNLPAKPESTGLGLWITRSLARAQGGDVSCEPAPGGGACFLLRLPAAPSQRDQKSS